MTNLKIKKVNHKVGKNNNPYIQYETDQGNFSCFKEDANEKLKQMEGQNVDVEITERNGFRNIVAFLGTGAATSSVMPTPSIPVEKCNNASQPVQLQAVSEEAKFRINIKKSAKDKHYYEVTVRASSITEAREYLNDAITLAKEKCTVLDEQAAGSGFNGGDSNDS
jgi:hypothetical protein|tara:strand:- start:703 stop:1200 length:498 start_codon:yes stop_codon:yes gene_type:complete